MFPIIIWFREFEFSNVFNTFEIYMSPKKKVADFQLNFFNWKNSSNWDRIYLHIFQRYLFSRSHILPLLMVARKFFATLDTTKGVYKWYLSGWLYERSWTFSSPRCSKNNPRRKIFFVLYDEKECPVHKWTEIDQK